MRYIHPSRLKIILLLLLCCSVFSSCLSLALNMIGAYEEEAEPHVYENGAKTMVYIPMRHIGLPQFYSDVKHNIDSLHNEGYIVFVESVKLKDSLSQAQKDTLELKLRKIIGTSLTGAGYLDTINHRLMGRKFKNRKGLINQPRYSKMGVDTVTDRVVDVPYNLLIAEYERKYGPVMLNPCDYTLPHEDKYDCGTEPSSQKDYIVLHYRNKALADSIRAEKHNKIAVIYGALHENGLFFELRKADSLWKRQSKPKAAVAK